MTIVGFFVAPIAGVLMARLPARGMLAAGLLLVGHRPDPDRRRRAGRRVDRPARRVPGGGCGNRVDQPGDRERRSQRRAARAERHGVGHQRHVPSGRDRRRHRRLRRAVPGHRSSPRSRRGSRRGRAWPGGGGLVGEPARGCARPGGGRRARGLPGRLQPDHADRGRAWRSRARSRRSCWSGRATSGTRRSGRGRAEAVPVGRPS